MPSKSKKQAKLMRAVAHGWKPNRIKGPTRTVAQEFVDADERRSKVTGYQFGGMAGMGPVMRGAGRMMPGGRMPRGGVMGGQYRGVPPQRGGIQPGGGPGGGRGPLAQMFQQAQQQRGQQPPGGGGWMSRLRQMIEQQRGQQPGGGRPVTDFVGGPGGGRPVTDFVGGPGGGGRLDPYSEGELGRRGPRGPLAPGGGGGPLQRPPGGWLSGPNVIEENPMMESGQRLYGGRPTPGLHDRQDMLMGEGPGGRLEMEGRARQAKMRAMQGRGGPRGIMNQAQNRYGALTQGGPGGGGSFGKITPNIPGRRIAPPPSRRGPIGGRGGRGGRGGFGGRRGARF